MFLHYDCKTVEETYNIKEDIVGLVFDTTAVNTGHKNGINARLNLIFDREVLHLACRHHVHELHLKRFVQAITGQTKDLGKVGAGLG